MRTQREIEDMIRRVDNTRDDDTETDDPNEVIFQTLRWVLGEADAYMVTDYLPD